MCVPSWLSEGQFGYALGLYKETAIEKLSCRVTVQLLWQQM